MLLTDFSAVKFLNFFPPNSLFPKKNTPRDVTWPSTRETPSGPKNPTVSSAGIESQRTKKNLRAKKKEKRTRITPPTEILHINETDSSQRNRITLLQPTSTCYRYKLRWADHAFPPRASKEAYCFDLSTDPTEAEALVYPKPWRDRKQPETSQAPARPFLHP